MNATAKSEGRIRYDERFKAEVIRDWKTSHRPARIVAKERGISTATLYLWGREFRLNHGEVVSRLIWEREQEIGRLREEQGMLRQQCEILKKMLSIFVELPNPAAGTRSTRSRTLRRRAALADQLRASGASETT